MKVQTVQFTHNDLDGAGCAIIARKALGKQGRHIETNYCGYEDINDKVGDFLDVIDDPSGFRVLITDISVNEEIAKRINAFFHEGLDVTLIDHHKTALWLNRYAWAFVNTELSGTALIFAFFLKEKPSLDYVDFMTRVNDYDLWIHAFPESKELNRLFGILGRERFVARFLDNPSIEFSDFERNLLELDDERRQRYTDKIAKKTRLFFDNVGKRFGVVYADQYISEIANDLIERLNLDYIAVVDALGEKVSLRSRPGVDVGEIAKLYGGGGHKNAAGFQINDTLTKAFIKLYSFGSNLTKIS